METIEELKEMGLDDNEIKVYLSCLELGPSKSDDVAKKAKLIRTTTYSILQKLKQKGIISNILKDNINIFEAVEPEKLLELLEEKKQKINSILPKLKSIQNKEQNKYNVTYFEGENGIKTIMNDIIEVPNTTIKSFGTVYSFFESSPYYSKEYFRKKKERNIKSISVAVDTPEGRFGEKYDKEHIRDTKYVKGEYSTAGCFIYRDKVALGVYEKGSQRGVIIQNEIIKKHIEIMFDALRREAK